MNRCAFVSRQTQGVGHTASDNARRAVFSRNRMQPTPVVAGQLTSRYGQITESFPVSIGFSVNCEAVGFSAGGTWNIGPSLVSPVNATALPSQEEYDEFVVYTRPTEAVEFQDYKHYEAAGRHILGIDSVTGAEYPHRLKEIAPHTGAVEAVVVVFQ